MGIPLGTGFRTHFEISCPECGCLFARPNAWFKGFANSDTVAMDELIDRTRPETEEAEFAWVAEEENWIAGKLAGEQRGQLLAEILGATEYMVRVRARQGVRESISALIVFAALGFLVGTLIAFGVGAKPMVTIPLLAGLVVFGVLTLYRGLTDMKAAARIHGLARLAPAFARLNPGRSDVEEALRVLRVRKREIAKWIDAAAVERAIESCAA